jgi:uncharacterized membrane protein YoaK (UPF0700 family)
MVPKEQAQSPLTFEEAQKQVGVLGHSALLAAASGFLDGFTYVGHGHVFANAMTGNVVLLGINILSGPWHSAFRHLPPILAFLLGISVSAALQLHSKRQHRSPPYVTVLVAEIGILFGLSLLPARTNDLLITTIIAFTASVQVSIFREVNGRSYSSTFTTGNLRTLSEATFAWLFEGHRSELARVMKDFSVICLAFLLGATTGGYATHAFGNRALWCDMALFLLIAVLVERGVRRPFGGG